MERGKDGENERLGESDGWKEWDREGKEEEGKWGGEEEKMKGIEE